MKKAVLLFFLLCLLLMLSCKPQVPGRYIQPGEFEDILYDIHLADAMAGGEDEEQADPYKVYLNRQAVYRKYDISQAEFDSSLVYYMRHADRLHKIYENLSKRLGDAALSLGASANDISRYGDLKSARDTSNLWKGVSSCVLIPYAPYNVMSFEITADSTYHNGDRIIFSFDTDFIFQSGQRDGIALLAVEFKNDSVASSTVRVSSNSNYSVTVADNDKKGIKAIRGFVYLNNADLNEESASLRLMSVYNIRMVRMRYSGSSEAAAPMPDNKRPADSVRNVEKLNPEVKQLPLGKPLPSDMPLERKRMVNRKFIDVKDLKPRD